MINLSFKPLHYVNMNLFITQDKNNGKSGCGTAVWGFPCGFLKHLMFTIPLPRSLLWAMANRSVDWWVMSEGLPDRENRVFLGSVQVQWRIIFRVGRCCNRS